MSLVHPDFSFPISLLRLHLLIFLSSIAKYTNDYSYLARWNPDVGEILNTELPSNQRLTSPKQFYSSLPDPADLSHLRNAPALDLGAPALHGRDRIDSRSQTMDLPASIVGAQDSTMSAAAAAAAMHGSEPKMFPGLLHRKQSMKLNSRGVRSGSDGGVESSASLQAAMDGMTIEESESE